MGDLSEHFSTAELACKDCGSCVLDPGLVPALEKLRSAGGDLPILVDCGYRCPLHNAAVGGVKNSTHLEGKAADIKLPGKTLQEMYDLAVGVGVFGGIGVYDTNFIHVDVRTERARWARVKGVYVAVTELVTDPQATTNLIM